MKISTEMIIPLLYFANVARSMPGEKGGLWNMKIPQFHNAAIDRQGDRARGSSAPGSSLDERSRRRAAAFASGGEGVAMRKVRVAPGSRPRREASAVTPSKEGRTSW